MQRLGVTCRRAFPARGRLAAAIGQGLLHLKQWPVLLFANKLGMNPGVPSLQDARAGASGGCCWPWDDGLLIGEHRTRPQFVWEDLARNPLPFYLQGLPNRAVWIWSRTLTSGTLIGDS